MSLEQFIKENQSEFDDRKMPEYLSSGFESRLKNELHKEVSHVKLISYAGGLLGFILLTTLALSYKNKKDIASRKNELVAAIDNSSNNSERLEAIYDMEDLLIYKKEDEKILSRFFKILRSDSDVNSKIAVIDALLNFPQNTEVRNQLIEALGNETEPLVQLKLINSVAILREQRAKAPLKKIIENKESLPLVKGNATALLAMLNQ